MNGFMDGPYAPPGPQASMRVGDLLVLVDGKDVGGAALSSAMSAIETARRRVRRRGRVAGARRFVPRPEGERRSKRVGKYSSP